MDFLTYLKDSAVQIDHFLDRFLTEWVREVSKTSPKLKKLAKTLAQACRGGKRLRGTLVKLGYEMTQSVILNSFQDLEEMPKQVWHDIIKIASAYEIFHTAILAHDDVVDKSPLRRGQPTIYKALGRDHYAISQTICLGDIGFFLAVKLLTESQFPKESLNLACQFFADTVVKTAVGEMLDVELPHLREVRKEEDVIKIMQLKTAQYTISGPLILGAILAGAKAGQLGQLDKFGESLGIAFQIQDDILGVFGDEEELGKSTSSDIEEGKNTLLITEALKRANLFQRKILNKYYGREGLGNRGLEEVRQVFRETGALDYALQFAVKYVTVAKKYIPEITADKQTRKLLEEMAEYLVERKK